MLASGPKRRGRKKPNFNSPVKDAGASAAEFSGLDTTDDEETDTESARLARFESQPSYNRFEELRPIRERERLQAVKQGLIDDPDKPKALKHALTFIGTCKDMCPEFEREQREYQKNLERWEINPTTGRVDKHLAVKAFHRPAAGNEQPLPSDVRPPRILKKTLDYLIDKIVCGPESLEATHSFVRDRTRSIRQDFTLQNDRGLLAIECHERIARYHILCLHQLCEMKGFSEQQETEQLRKVLQSLTEFYDDARKDGIESPNEAEFRSYHLLTHIRDPDMSRQAQILPAHLFFSHPVQHACRLIAMASRNNEQIGRLKPQNYESALNQFSRLFKTVGHRSTTYLMACILETSFGDIRKGALKAMRKAYLDRQRPFPAKELAELLGCDDELQVEEICLHYKLEIEVDTDGRTVAVKLHNRASWDENQPTMRQQFSKRLVEPKRAGAPFNVVINNNEMPIQSFLPSSDKRKTIPKVASKPPQLNPLADAFVPPRLGRSPSATAKPKSPTAREGTITASPYKPLTIPSHLSMKSPPVSSSFVPSAANLVRPKPSQIQSSFNISPNDLEGAFRHSVLDITRAVVRATIEAEESERTLHLKQEIFLQKCKTLSLEVFYNIIHSVAIGEWINCIAQEQYRRSCLRKAYVAFRKRAHVFHQQQLEQKKLHEEEQARKHQYRTAMVLLDKSKPRSLQPVRSLNLVLRRLSNWDLADMTESLEQATKKSESLWSPLDLQNAIVSPLNNRFGLDLNREKWSLVIVAAAQNSSTLEWIESKFQLKVDSTRCLEWNGDSEIVISLQTKLAPEPTKDLRNVGALIYEISGDEDGLLRARSEFHLAMRQAASSADYQFPVLILHWTDIRGLNVADLLQFENLSDISSTIAVVQIFTVTEPSESDLGTALSTLSKYYSNAKSASRVERENKDLKRKRHINILQSSTAADRNLKRRTMLALHKQRPERQAKRETPPYDEQPATNLSRSVSQLYETISEAEKLLAS